MGLHSGFKTLLNKTLGPLAGGKLMLAHATMDDDCPARNPDIEGHDLTEKGYILQGLGVYGDLVAYFMGIIQRFMERVAARRMMESQHSYTDEEGSMSQSVAIFFCLDYNKKVPQNKSATQRARDKGKGHHKDATALSEAEIDAYIQQIRPDARVPPQAVWRRLMRIKKFTLAMYKFVAKEILETRSPDMQPGSHIFFDVGGKVTGVTMCMQGKRKEFLDNNPMCMSDVGEADHKFVAMVNAITRNFHGFRSTPNIVVHSRDTDVVIILLLALTFRWTRKGTNVPNYNVFQNLGSGGAAYGKQTLHVNMLQKVLRGWVPSETTSSGTPHKNTVKDEVSHFMLLMMLCGTDFITKDVRLKNITPTSLMSKYQLGIRTGHIKGRLISITQPSGNTWTPVLNVGMRLRLLVQMLAYVQPKPKQQVMHRTLAHLVKWNGFYFVNGCVCINEIKLLRPSPKEPLGPAPFPDPYAHVKVRLASSPGTEVIIPYYGIYPDAELGCKIVKIKLSAFQVESRNIREIPDLRHIGDPILVTTGATRGAAPKRRREHREVRVMLDVDVDGDMDMDRGTDERKGVEGRSGDMHASKDQDGEEELLGVLKGAVKESKHMNTKEFLDRYRYKPRGTGKLLIIEDGEKSYVHG